MILGVDEVGRGPWAGPLVVGAVALNNAKIDGLTDSKKLTKRRREALYAEIIGSDASVGLGWVYPDELDAIGLSQSLVEATKRAVQQIKSPYHEIIIDGTVNFLRDTTKGQYVTTLKKADLLIPSVSAASIVAKVARDEYMRLQDKIYPGYDFASNAGYGTVKHKAAIDQLGATPLHRRSFSPLKTVKASTKSQTVKTTKAIGDSGEDAACEWLLRNGYDIIERNWKTKLCEIDIVASREGVLYFVEVKHRKDAKAGGGIAAITPKKRRQMEFAAKLYLHFQKYSADARLAVITTIGEVSEFESFLELE